MANKAQLALLKQGVEVWNKWRENNPKAEIDLSGANLRKANLRDANFREADLRKVDLTGADLTRAAFLKADLSEARLSLAQLDLATFWATNLRQAKLRGAFLFRTEFYEADLSEAKLTKARFFNALVASSNLSRAILKNTDFINTDLQLSDFSQSNLRKAQLIRTQALGTNFNEATVTGAHLVDWHTNSAANLDDVICEYVYLKHNQQEHCPSSGNFAPGEFTKLFQKALETVDLIFRNGVDWDAFAYSFKKVEVEHSGAQLDVQSIEKKGGGVLVVRISVSPDADKARIHSDFMQGYEFAHRVLEAQYQARLEDKDQHINQLFNLLNQSNEKLGEVPRLMAEAPKYDMRGSNFQGGFAETNYGKMVETQYNNMSQDLSQAAAQIQKLLTQLLTQGFSPEDAQQQIAQDLAKQAQSSPTVMGKLVKWGQSLGDAAAKTTVSEAVKAVLKLALSLSGVQLL
jgi:uncharacterized protein YjbI with pentapeptide repeats